jgi:transcriptional regulator with XRE-family HTH domain
LEDLAARIRTTKANLSRIETFKQTISDELLANVVAETGIPAGRLRPDLAKLFRVSRARPRRHTSAAA